MQMHFIGGGVLICLSLMYCIYKLRNLQETKPRVIKGSRGVGEIQENVKLGSLIVNGDTMRDEELVQRTHSLHEV